MRLLSLDGQENQTHKPMMEGKSLTFIEAELGVICLISGVVQQKL